MTGRGAQPARDPALPGRLFGAELESLVPVLRECPDAGFGRPVAACPGWTVRDVLAHCSGDLTQVVNGDFGDDLGSPEANERDIAARADWPHTRIVDELEHGLRHAGPAVAAAGGPLDKVALGVWLHGGDVRDTLGVPGAYDGPGLPDALALLSRLTHERGRPLVHACFDGAGAPFVLGAPAPGVRPVRFHGDAPTLIRLCSGRATHATYELSGGVAEALNMFG
ncbi:maleylpyruvate isomerase family mycothiol-dependent enzyme [Streptomyces sp. J2-1]|uniref:maleylpyruvate isomerase family mycothiol-dependent enzyme n=1 Tax=Streptomyces corallincola TaxID=2851888 RepID=UPI001C38B921|nr:maleylpyruvate isomerase family mycothiol-dependent enzyme [Streptomyces corallincola]MBV2355733.1 maleylpyruvate isomerase family mycothiol-dependent enzyme [Streptomyces corallincola]